MLGREERGEFFAASVDLPGQDFHPGEQHRFLAGRFVVEVLVGIIGRLRLLRQEMVRGRDAGHQQRAGLLGERFLDETSGEGGRRDDQMVA